MEYNTNTIRKTIYGIVMPILIGVGGANYVQGNDCAQKLIDLSKANSQVEKLTDIERRNLSGKNKINPLDKRELDITKKLKEDAIKERDKIFERAKNCF